MKIFTYKNYLNCKKIFDNSNLDNTTNESNIYYNYAVEYNKFNLIVAEKQEEYKYEVNKEHDKVFRKILSNNEEAAKLINKALKLDNKILAKEIEKYNNSYITEKLENRESDIVYRLKNKNIFFLIEHQTLIDYSMSYRILEYEYEIIKSAIDENKIKQKEYKLPKVIPIVLYTGRKKWNAKTKFKDTQEEQEKVIKYKGTGLGEYNIVDVNEYSEEELLKEESFLTKAMLIEKARYTGTIAQYLLNIVEEMNKKQNIYMKEQKELFKIIINIALRNKLTQEEIKSINFKLNDGGEENMLAVEQMVIEENKRIFRQGVKQEKKETARKMKAENIPIETIVKITGLSREKIEKLS